jgi:hypothetical protein
MDTPNARSPGLRDLALMNLAADQGDVAPDLGDNNERATAVRTRRRVVKHFSFGI